jgi:hypothetical protein
MLLREQILQSGRERVLRRSCRFVVGVLLRRRDGWRCVAKPWGAWIGCVRTSDERGECRDDEQTANRAGERDEVLEGMERDFHASNP